MIKLLSPIRSIDIAEILQMPLHGASDVVIDNIGSLQDYNDRSILFSTSDSTSLVAGCLIAPSISSALSGIVTNHPRKTFRKLLESLSLPPRDSEHTGIHASALIAPNAMIGKDVTIGPFSVIESDVVLGDGVTIGSHCHIMQYVKIGTHGAIGPHTTVYPHTNIGTSVRIGAQCVLGDEGFGYEWDNTHWALLPQIAELVIEDNVTIGPMSVIDRGALNNTVIGQGSTLDAHVMIGHGVRLGKNVVMAACAAIGGSSHVGDFTVAGGCVQISDHIDIAPHTRLAGGASVGRSIKNPGEYASAIPAMPAKNWRMWYKHMLRIISSDTN